MTNDDRLLELARTLGHEFADPEILARALRHGSSEAAKEEGTYQRLEFLGDAVLGLAVAELLFEAMPGADQGQLTRMRALLTRSSTLAHKAAELELDEMVEVGRSEESEQSRRRQALLEDLFEAVLGALMVDGGWQVAYQFVAGQFADDIPELDDRTLVLADPKTELQELAQAQELPLPEYREVSSTGPDHRPLWVFDVMWDGELMGRGEAATKREAHKKAAQRALERLGHLPGPSR